ncbi:SusC/RagA family TonB-linked outer membrane protein [Polaribacter sp.]|uniref:SusC/RagA family TonB-linked outer membrane protein n=1 Tax=Polaribacter sp. TaxID=1920175 RepID=UPI004047EEB7
MNKKRIIFLLTFLTFSWVNAQINVSGKVTDTSGEVLPGVSVVIKGTSVGAVTNFDGEYTINVPNNESILQFRFLGMKTKDVAFNGVRVLNVVLEEEQNRLNEIVIVGYSAVKKEDITGSISSIKDSLIAVNKTPNLFDAIQGRIAGVNISSQSGEPGAGVSFNVRGSNSVFSAGSPLFIIDGVQIDINEGEVASAGVGSVARMDPLATINPLDIESLEVLKDASATAMFGSRGANGVIIITTKSGKKGKMSLELTSSVGVSEATKTINIINPDEYLIYRELRDPGNSFTNITTGGAPRDFSTLTSRNWQDEALRTAMLQNHFLSVRGGLDKSNYSASLGMVEQEGVIVNNNFRKYNGSFKITHQQNDNLKLGFTINSAMTESTGVANSGGGGDEFNGVVQFLVIANPWELPDLDDAEQFGNSNFISPLSLIYEAKKKMKFTRTFGSLFAEYDFSKAIKFRTQAGATFTGSKLQEFHSSNSLFGFRWNGRAVVRQVESSSYNISSTLRYMKTFNKKHWVNVLVGAEAASYLWESFFNDVTGFENQSLGYNNIGLGQVFNDYGTSALPSNRISYFTSANYTLKGKYLFTANFRADASDRFGSQNRWGYFPGAAFAWNAHKESFIKNNIPQINQLKIRASYGQTGNERIPPFTFAGGMENAFYASNDNLSFGLAPSSLENPDLKWETTTQFDIGLDVGLFDDRIHLTADYYNKQTTDMLINAPVPAQSGFNSQWQNLGALENKGFEFSISTVNINKPNFKWTTDFNISFNRNKVKDLGNVEFIPTIINGGWITNPGRVIVGEPVGIMYGYVFDGIHQTGNTQGATPGTMKYKDLNGDGLIDDANDRTVIGDSNPLHVGGFNNSFTMKNFTFSFFFQWSYGNEIFNAAKLRTNGLQPFMNITRDYYENAWTDQNQSNIAPAFGKIDQVPSSYFVEDGSFLRLKTVNLSYDLPKEALKNSSISGVSLFLSANNLFTITKYTGFDPEVVSNNSLLPGFERFSYPRARTITLGLTVKL